MKNKKIFLLCLIVVVLLICAFAMIACDNSTSPDTDDGKENYSTISFKLNDDGKSYSVTGIGTFSRTNLVIPSVHSDGKPITSIDKYAFYNCTGLTIVTIPDSVTSIGEHAFELCTGLTSITIGSGVTSIGVGAFYGCTGLTSVTIGNSVENIENGAFEHCFRLVEIYNKSSLELTIGSKDNGYIGYYAKNIYTMEGGSKLTTDKNGFVIYVDGNEKSLIAYRGYETGIVLPDGITDINQYAFNYCYSLTNLTIPDSVTSIGYDAFFGCYKLVEIYNKSSLELTICSRENGCVGYYAKNIYTTEGGSKLTTDKDGFVIYVDGNEKSLMAYCGTETDIVLPDGLTYIFGFALRDCSRLTSIIIPDGVASIGDYAFAFCEGLTSITIPNSVTVIGSYAFRRCYGLTSVTIGSSVTGIYDYAFLDCIRLVEICNKSSLELTIGSDDNGFIGYYAKNIYTTEGGSKLTTDNNGFVIYVDGNEKSLIAYRGTKTDIVLPDGITAINRFAFEGCTGLTSVTIPDSVISIGNSSFRSCNGLTSITIGKSVTSIGYLAFMGCTGLASITIPDSVTSIDNNAFNKCTGLISIYYLGDIESLCEIDGLGTLMKKERTLYIGGNKFEGVLMIPNSVTNIREYAFSGCTSLTSVTIGSSVTSIGDYAFSGCTGLTSITIPDSVTSIGNRAFWGCNGLTSVTIGSSMIIIGDGAFSECYRLVEIYNRSSLKLTLGSEDNGYIGYYAKNIYTTEGGSKLTTDNNGFVIYVDENEKSLIAYSGTETDIVLPDGITDINRFAFGACHDVTSITIPDSITSIGDYAFNYCQRLKSIKYLGTVEQWKSIPKDSSIGIYPGYSCTVICTDGTVSL